jgi:2-octaprenylphenol hydroxylase
LRAGYGCAPVAEDFDVVIVGGGPVGACAAALLARTSERRGRAPTVAVLEREIPAAPPWQAPVDLRVAAFSRASERILNAAGAWDAIRAARVAPYERMCIWHESVPVGTRGTLVFEAAEAGEPNLGYILEVRLVQAALLESARAAGVTLLAGEFTSLRVDEKRVRLATSHGELSTRLVVGADGARSPLRAAAGLSATRSDYGQIAIVANVATEIPHANTAWQRFMRDGTLALLPLFDGTSSIVWSADTERARSLLAATPEDFAGELDRASARALGTTRLVSERVSFALEGLSAERYVSERCALIGDAAHVIHPLAGQGMNLGILDAAALVELLQEAHDCGEDPGALRILRRYERWRRSETAVMRVAVDTFDRLLAHGSGPLAQTAQRGLAWVNDRDEIKRAFMARALGLSGELPRAARAAGSGRPSLHR